MRSNSNVRNAILIDWARQGWWTTGEALLAAWRWCCRRVPTWSRREHIKQIRISQTVFTQLKKWNSELPDSSPHYPQLCQRGPQSAIALGSRQEEERKWEVYYLVKLLWKSSHQVAVCKHAEMYQMTDVLHVRHFHFHQAGLFILSDVFMDANGQNIFS